MASIVTDIKDFETCFHQHFEMLHHYAYTIVKDSDEAKDIVQAAFVKLWALYTNLEIKHSVKAYLYRSVYNLSINYLRDARTRHRHVSLAAKRSDWDAPSLPLFEKEFAAALAREIEKLPPQCKVVFLKSRVEEKKNAEIAIELGVSIKAVESQITKALKLLRQNLAQHMTAVGLLLLYDQTVLYG